MSNLTKKWVKTLPMAVRLGMSSTALCRMAKKDLVSNDRYLQKGVHYNQLGEAVNSPFYWNVELTEEVFANWGAPVQEVQSEL